MQMQEEIAKADASTAWCLGQCSVCAMTAAYLDPDAANEIFNTAPGILAWGAINHEVQVVPGGYKASARWDFASGRGRRAGSAPMCASSRPMARRGASRMARRNSHHPVSGDQRHDVRRLGRDRPKGHRHRFLFGRNLSSRKISALRDKPQPGAKMDRCTSSPPTWCSAWALRRPRSASPAPRSMPRSTARGKTPQAQKAMREQCRAGRDRPHRSAPARGPRLSLCHAAEVWRDLSRGEATHRSASIALRIATTWTIHQSAAVVEPPITWPAPRPCSTPTSSNAVFATCTRSRNRSRAATPIMKTPARRSCQASSNAADEP